MQCAVEVNPLKIGKYIPGARIPIVDETKTAPPDAYLLLAWNFLAEFLPKTPGLFLYFPARTQMQPKLRAFIDMLTAAGKRRDCGRAAARRGRR